MIRLVPDHVFFVGFSHRAWTEICPADIISLPRKTFRSEAGVQKKTTIKFDVDMATFAGITALGALLVAIVVGCIVGFATSL